MFLQCLDSVSVLQILVVIIKIINYSQNKTVIEKQQRENAQHKILYWERAPHIFDDILFVIKFNISFFLVIIFSLNEMTMLDNKKIMVCQVLLIIINHKQTLLHTNIK